MTEAFGKYQLRERIARGRLAEVFAAIEPLPPGFPDRVVAVKRMFSHLVDDGDIVDMFIDEARIASRLDHEHIIDIYDLGTVDGTFFIAMEYVEGLDLGRAMQLGIEHGERLSRPVVAYIASGLASALEHAHAKTGENMRPMNIVHRDVSPGNVLLGVDGSVKLCDFGLARAESRLSDTETGEFKGRSGYKSPEQFDRGTVDHRSDVFGLGIVLYEAFLGRRLFDDEIEFEVMRRIVDGDIRRPSKVEADFPAALEEIVMRALSAEPDQRFQSAGAMQQQLDRWLDQNGHRGLREMLGERVRRLRDYLDDPVRSTDLRFTSEFGRQEVVDPGGESTEITRQVGVSKQKRRQLEQSSDTDRQLPAEDEDTTHNRSIDPSDLVGLDPIGDELSNPDPDGEPGAPAESVEAPKNNAHQVTEPTDNDDHDNQAQRTGSSPKPERSKKSARSMLAEMPALRAGGRELTGVSDLKQRRPREETRSVPAGKSGLMARLFAEAESMLEAIGPRRVFFVLVAVTVVALGGIVILAVPGGEKTGDGEESEGDGEITDRYTGEVTVGLDSEPSGAHVVVNGELTGQSTPVELSLAAEQDHEIWLFRRDRRPKRLVVEAGDESVERIAELAPAATTRPITLDLQTTPAGARVFVDGEPLGRTPFRMEKARGDFITHLQFEKEGYRPFVGFVEFESDDEAELQALLTPGDEAVVMGAYRIRPEETAISVDGEQLGTTPFDRRHGVEQRLDIEAETEGRSSQRFLLGLERLGGFELATELEASDPKRGRVSLRVDQPVSVFADGRPLGNAPVEEKALPAGELPVVFETVDGRHVSAMIEIEAGEHRQYTVDIDGESARVSEN